jgi:hypothetical protein
MTFCSGVCSNNNDVFPEYSISNEELRKEYGEISASETSCRHII